MKKLILIILILGAAGYWVWPYYSTSQFHDAVTAGDSRALQKLVDFPSVRASVKPALRERVIELLKPRLGEKGAQTVANLAPVNALIDKVLENRVTPERLPDQLKKRPGKDPAAELTISSRSWKSPTTFQIGLAETSARLNFKLSGLDGWRLDSVEVDPAQFDEELKAAMADAKSLMLQVGQGAGNIPSLAPPKPAQKPYVSPLDLPPTRSGKGGL